MIRYFTSAFSEYTRPLTPADTTLDEEKDDGNSSPNLSDLGNSKSKLNVFGEADGELMLLDGIFEEPTEELFPLFISIDRACFKPTGRMMSVDVAFRRVAVKAERKGRLVGGSDVV